MLHSRHPVFSALAMLVVISGALAISGCRRPRDGHAGSPGRSVVVVIPPSDTDVTDSEDLPGVHINVVSLEGNSGGDGNFNAGDEVTVNFTLTRDDGSLLLISELDHLEGHISGPTFNYQIVVPEQEDLREKSVANEDGSYSYTFPALPETYLDPPNFTGANTTDVLAGTDLLDGTYTVVLVGFRNYSVGGSKILKDVGNTVYDFLYGDASAVEPRAVVQVQNCAQCHDTIQHHTEGLPGGGIMRDVRVCVTCHVAGAEDMNDPAVAGGTPGATIEFKVMIHKIHNSENLPSYQGIATNPDGSRNYNVPREPYELVSEDLEVREYEIQFPVWPNLNIAMPKDYGYTISEDIPTKSLAKWDGPTSKFINEVRPDDGRSWRSMDDKTRMGVTACAKCHGDPDDAGPLEAPAQGNLSYIQPTRRACGSCHDDVDWELPYRSNLKTMDPQADDSGCITCHVGGSDPKIDSELAHVHPLLDSTQMPTGLQNIHVNILGAHPPTGSTVNAGTGKLVLDFTVTDDTGANVALVPGPWPSLPKFPTNYGPAGPGGVGTTAIFPYLWPSTATNWFSTMSLVVSGPTQNYNLLNYVTVPLLHPALNIPTPADGVYHLTVPEIVLYERLGRQTIGAAEFFTTTRQNHLNIPFYAPTFVMARAPLPTASGFVLAAPVAIGQSWIDVTDLAVGTTWAKNQMVCLNDASTTALQSVTATASEEYLRIQAVEPDINGTLNDRLWFTSPYAQNSVACNSNAAGVPDIGALPTTTGTTTWYGPWARFTHAAGEPITRVSVNVLASGLTPVGAVVPAVWTLSGVNNNTITEVGVTGWGATGGETILCSYTGDWQCPTNYPATFNSSPDLNETWGEWEGKRVLPGTYTVGLWTRYPWRHVDPDLTPWAPVIAAAGKDPGYNYEVDSYPITSEPGNADFLVNNTVLNAAPFLQPVPTEIEPYETLATHGETCNECHNDIWFHGGGRRGYDTCLVCHGVAGSEDWPRYRSASPITPATTTLPTPGVTINFRTMLHKIHTGKNLYYASSYYIVGNSGNASNFDDIEFPVENGYSAQEGTRNCAKCHGEPEPGKLGSWEVPRNRNHPTDQVALVREYKAVCNSCHDSGDTTAHIDLNTSPAGEESCATCHGPGATYGVGIMHKPK